MGGKDGSLYEFAYQSQEYRIRIILLIRNHRCKKKLKNEMRITYLQLPKYLRYIKHSTGLK